MEKDIEGNTALKQDIETAIQDNYLCFDFNSKYSNQAFGFEWGTYYPSVKGRIGKNTQFWWGEISANTASRDKIEHGYKIPFLTTPNSPSFHKNLSALKSDTHLSKKSFIGFNESPLKMMKNAFYFILKAFFVLKIFKFLSWLFGQVEKIPWLEK